MLPVSKEFVTTSFSQLKASCRGFFSSRKVSTYNGPAGSARSIKPADISSLSRSLSNLRLTAQNKSARGNPFTSAVVCIAMGAAIFDEERRDQVKRLSGNNSAVNCILQDGNFDFSKLSASTKIVLKTVGFSITALNISHKAEDKFTITPERLRELYEYFPNVTSLHVAHCNLTNDTLAEVASFQKLQFLNLSYNQSLDEQGLKKVCHLELRGLALDGLKVKKYDIEDLFPTLEHSRR